MHKKIIAAVIGTSAVTAMVAADANASTYRVKAGESLWSIATKYNITISQLKSYNNLSSNLIFPNQVLKVSGSTAGTSNHVSSSGNSSTYTVVSGDSLSSIAARYGTTYQHIMQLNGLNSFMIYPGQKLKVSGTASTPSRQKPAKTSGSTTYYTVQPGDSLSLIASKYGTTYQNIMNLNGLDSFLIFPGQKLKVKGTASAPNHTTPSKPAKPATNGATTYYTVQPGDSLSLIASKYGTTYQNIMQLNGLNSFLIFPGQKLKVSGSAASTGTTTAPNRQYQTPIFNHENYYDWGQCTWYVFNKRKEAGLGISTYWWNANAWDDNAARDGYTIDRNPTVGSILQSDLGYYGHVSYVERVNPDGSILVSEMNFTAGPGVLTYRTVPSYNVANFKYIH